MLTRKLLAVLFFFLLLSVGCIEAADSPVEQLFNFLNERFLLAEDVAAYNYVHRLPIGMDKAQQAAQQEILVYARHLGFNELEARALLAQEAVMDHHLQLKWMKQWQTKGFPKGYVVKDYRTVLLPRQNEIDKQLLNQFVKVAPLLSTQNTQQIFFGIMREQLLVPFVTAHEKKQLAARLFALDRA